MSDVHEGGREPAAVAVTPAAVETASGGGGGCGTAASLGRCPPPLEGGTALANAAAALDTSRWRAGGRFRNDRLRG